MSTWGGTDAAHTPRNGCRHLETDMTDLHDYATNNLARMEAELRSMWARIEQTASMCDHSDALGAHARLLRRALEHVAIARSLAMDAQDLTEAKKHDSDTRTPMEHVESGEVHYFASSALNWTCAATVWETLQGQHKVDTAGSVETTGCALWRVPGPVERPYLINDYAPQVPGAEFICNVDY